MARTRISQVLSFDSGKDNITIMGWVRTRRDSKGGFSFIELNDGSCLSNLQVIADSTLSNYQDEILKIQTGCSVKINRSSCPVSGERPENGNAGREN